MFEGRDLKSLWEKNGRRFETSIPSVAKIDMNVFNPSVVKSAILISNSWVGKIDEDLKPFSGKMCDLDLKSLCRKI